MLTKKQSFKYLIGIDEVGRGPIAGPVVVGAFCIPVKNLVEVRRIFRGVKESKQLSEIKREEWFLIIQNAQKSGLVDFRVTFQSEKVIDTKGLSFAIKKALEISLRGVVQGFPVVANSSTFLTNSPLKRKIESPHGDFADFKVLLDGGLEAPPHYLNQKTIIKGDEKELVIALASICAKVLRDRKMNALALKHPKYGFYDHKGYGTKKHYQAIKNHGMLSVHRKTFLL